MELVNEGSNNGSQKKARKYLCNKCEFTTGVSRNLKIHIQSIHEGKRYPCQKCDYKATQKTHLKSHINSIHLKIKYDCKKCEYKATTKSSLTLHMNGIHSSAKNYECNECKQKFKHMYESSSKSYP